VGGQGPEGAIVPWMDGFVINITEDWRKLHNECHDFSPHYML
jgi:hypothetical protein